MALASSDTWHTVLLDFDTACRCDGRLKDFTGTPRFWSPEKAAGMLDSGSTYDGLFGDLFSMGSSLLDVPAEVEGGGTGVARLGWLSQALQCSEEARCGHVAAMSVLQFVMMH